MDIPKSQFRKLKTNTPSTSHLHKKNYHKLDTRLLSKPFWTNKHNLNNSTSLLSSKKISLKSFSIEPVNPNLTFIGLEDSSQTSWIIIKIMEILELYTNKKITKKGKRKKVSFPSGIPATILTTKVMQTNQFISTFRIT